MVRGITWTHIQSVWNHLGPVSCKPVHRGAFCQFPFRWIYYCHSNKSTREESGKTHLCAVTGQGLFLLFLTANRLQKLFQPNVVWPKTLSNYVTHPQQVRIENLRQPKAILFRQRRGRYCTDKSCCCLQITIPFIANYFFDRKQGSFPSVRVHSLSIIDGRTRSVVRTAYAASAYLCVCTGSKLFLNLYLINSRFYDLKLQSWDRQNRLLLRL